MEIFAMKDPLLDTIKEEFCKKRKQITSRYHAFMAMDVENACN
jgi:hypothetical protein